MMKDLGLLIILSVIMVAASCSSTKPERPAAEPVTVAAVASLASGAAYMPKARAYRTDGDFADHVPVRLDVQGNALASYPAPSDLRRDCSPIVLADGWLLDRIGVGLNTVFTRYTLDEYRALNYVPTPQQLMDAVIPGSRVMEIVEFPFTTLQAEADTAQCNRLIREGLPGCAVLK